MPHPSRRRRHRRVDTVGWCFAQLGDGVEGSVQNLSAGGILLRLKNGLTPGSSYLLKLLIDGRMLVVEARVVRLLRGVEECMAGLEFVTVAPEDVALIRGWLRR